jgi:hypothetical protein
MITLNYKNKSISADGDIIFAHFEPRRMKWIKDAVAY